jgi:hypothetical protein
MDSSSAVEIIGVSDEKFLLRLWPEDRIVQRSYHHLFHFSKSLPSKQQQLPQFPSTDLKRLISCGNWDLNLFWNPIQTKTLSRVNKWLQQILTLKSYEFKDQFCNEIFFEEQLSVQKEKRLLESEARRLQQYFMSPENMDFLLEKLFEFHDERCLYLEPSCGDGRLLCELIQQLKRRKLRMRGAGGETEGGEGGGTDNESVTLWGCDIDPNAISRSHQNLLALSLSLNDQDPSSSSASVSSSSLVSQPSASLHLGNYLETTPETFLLSSTKPSRILIFGGPPYTCGGGTGLLQQSGDSTQDTGRDLPFHFIVHSAVALSAHAIVFLLPIRCQNKDFIERCQLEIQRRKKDENCLSSDSPPSSLPLPSPQQISSEDREPNPKKVKMTIEREEEEESAEGIVTSESQEDDGVRDPGERFAWRVSNFLPPNNNFDFCHRLIRQPVVIQIWQRRS